MTDLVAVFRLDCPACHTFGTTVATVPGACFVVVSVIAIAVSLVLRRPTSLRWFGVCRPEGEGEGEGEGENEGEGEGECGCG